ncbi:MAG: N-formylglutamate amidohydrolase [Paracoccus sp. (in: a-proteobacteria)]|nr:N-formylglutamate amidohydrolase [Paracoccus sp. (in: a-proteobacteria)]
MKDHIPDVLTIEGRDEQTIPLVLDSPHSGTTYPDDFRHAVDPVKLRHAEDTHVHDLWRGGLDHGAVLLHAHFPRSYIDPNRRETDMDPGAIEGAMPITLEPGEKSRLGIGLCWTREPPGGGPLYDRKLGADEVMARIETYHRPYQQTLRALLDETHARFGEVWHVNCHSMQEVASAMSDQARGTPRPDFVLGDRDGTTCAPEFTAMIHEFLTGRGYSVAINDPYKGQALIADNGAPDQGRHSIQIEVNRKTHMDEATREPNEGYGEIKGLFSDLSGRIADFLAERTEARS